MNQSSLRSLSIVATMVLIAAILILFSRGDLLSWNPVVMTVQTGSVVLMAWARLVLGFQSFHFSADPVVPSLVTSGPYRYIRHPIYAAVLLFTLAGIAAHFSLLNAGLAGLILLTILIRVVCEEAYLAMRFEDYPAYANRTSCLFPFL